MRASVKQKYTEDCAVFERMIIQDARFFEPYKDELHGLFQALGKEHEWSDNPRDMLEYLRRQWIGDDHGNAVEKDQFSNERIADAMPYLERMGFTKSHTPRSGQYFDQAVIVGGRMTANYRRIELVDELVAKGAKVDKIIFWLGRRQREKYDGTDEELLNTRGRFAGFGIRRNLWVKDLMKRGVFGLRRKAKLTETDLGRIAVLKSIDSKLMPYRIDLSVLNSEDGRRADLLDRIERLPEEYVTDYFFKTDEGADIILLNASSVDRGIGNDGKPRTARHTTESCTIEWLERHNPPKNAKVLYVTGNPHSLRTAQDTYGVLRRYKRDDIELVLAGTGPADNIAIQTYLGEIARLIDNDVKRNY